MTGPLQDQTVLVIGRAGGIARAVTLAARDAGAQVVAAGRDQRTLAAVYAGEPAITTETVDLTDEPPSPTSASGSTGSATWSPPPPRGPAAASPTWTATRSGGRWTPR